MGEPQTEQDFYPATPAPAPSAAAPVPDFIPADPATMPKPAPETPDFFPADPETKPSDGTGWVSSIMHGTANVLGNMSWGAASRSMQLATDAYHLNGKGVSTDIRDNLVTALMPWMDKAGAESHLETTPSEPIPKGKGAWQTTKGVATAPLAGTFHRKGAGTIESESEDWITGQLNPLNVGLAVASMGTSLVESALVKGGLTATRAAGLVRAGKIGVDMSFLSKFGYDVGTQAIPQLGRDWNDYNAEDNPAKKKLLLDKFERSGTDLVLGAIATGFAARGVTSDIRELELNSPSTSIRAPTK